MCELFLGDFQCNDRSLRKISTKICNLCKICSIKVCVFNVRIFEDLSTRTLRIPCEIIFYLLPFENFVESDIIYVYTVIP